MRGLKDVFEAGGLHSAKDHQKRVASCPIPKKQKLAHRNIRDIINLSKSSTKKCKHEWVNITRLTKTRVLSRSEQEELEKAKHRFILTLSADYQQSQLIPLWGKMEQPGSIYMYYLQRVSDDIFSAVDHSEEELIVYLFDYNNKSTLRTPTTLSPS